MYGLFDFAVVNGGVFFLRASGQPIKVSTYFHSFVAGKSSVVAEVGDRWPATGLAVSPDRSTILYTRNDQVDSDLMMVQLK